VLADDDSFRQVAAAARPIAVRPGSHLAAHGSFRGVSRPRLPHLRGRRNRQKDSRNRAERDVLTTVGDPREPPAAKRIVGREDRTPRSEVEYAP
jgi:hypothetical protein